MNARAVVSLALSGLLVWGCSSTRAGGEAQAAVSDGIAGALAYQDPRTGEEGGQRYLEFTMLNRSQKRVTARCKPLWFDARMRPISVPAAWRAVDLAPGAQARMRFAPVPAEMRSWSFAFEE